MIRHFLNTALRHFYRTKAFSLINITGLSIGITVALMLFIWMQHERSYDQFHKYSERIFRVTTGEVTDEDAWVGTPALLAYNLSEVITGIDSYVRMNDQPNILQANGKTFNEENTFVVDSNFFDVFSFELLAGNPESALKDRYSVVLTENTAKKYFGDLNPIGQTVMLGDVDLKITGIAKDPPANSHFHFNVLARFDLFSENMDCWGCFNFMTYLLLNKDADPEIVESKIRDFTIEWEGKSHSFENLNLQPLTDIHYEFIRGNTEPSFSRKYITIYSSLIVVILIMAWANYTNLNVAIAPLRFREVGIKKTFGADRLKLTLQFIFESVLATLTAIIIAIILTEIFMPSFNRLIDKQLNFNFADPLLISALIFSAILMGLVIGIYPALFTSSVPVSRVLKGISHTGNKSWFRNSLVVFQFMVSMAFILFAFILNKQLHFIRNQNLGFDREHVLNISFFPTGINSAEDLELYQNKAGLFKNECLLHSAVREASVNNFVPSTLNRNHGISFEGQKEDQSMSVFVVSGDRDFIDTYQIELKTPLERVENFESGSGPLSNRTFGYILNESAVEALEWENPLDKSFSIFGPDVQGRVIGVCKNFHYRSFHHQIGPCVIVVGEPGIQLSVSIKGDRIDNFIDYAKKEYVSIFPGSPFEYFFVDDDFDKLYKSEIRSIAAITVFTIISIIIASLGLYGLASYYTVQRTREIGIRKVMGADKRQIIVLFFKEISFRILIAIAIGAPIALILASNWLQNFTYKTQINWWIAPVTGLATLMIAWLTIGYQTLRASRKNPVEVLRYE